MKTKKAELDVDFIGGSALTALEEKALSDYFKSKKTLTPAKKIKQKVTTSKHENILV